MLLLCLGYMLGTVNLMVQSIEFHPFKSNSLVDKLTVVLPHYSKYLLYFFVCFFFIAPFPEIYKSKMEKREVLSDKEMWWDC